MPPGLIAVAALIFLCGGFGENSGLALLAVLELVAGAFLLWRPRESPVLLFIFCFQWLQASIAIFHANWLGADVANYSKIQGSMELAILLSLLSIMVLAIGMRFGAGSANTKYVEQISAVALASPVRKLFWLYVYASVASFLALIGAYILQTVSQPLLALASLKWAFYFMLAYATFIRSGKERRYLIVAFMLELMEGLGGYFADFRTVLFVTICAGVASRVRMSATAVAGLGLLSALTIGLGIAWSAVKIDFRSYVSGGLNAQNLTMSYGDRVVKLYELGNRIDGKALSVGADALLRRLSYVEYFGVVLDVVPKYVPYEEGAIWWDAVSRPFMPRLFFPNKQIIDDTKRTNQFTRGAAGSDRLSSISLGYVAEAYIDFGAYGMMVPIFTFGLLCGQIHRRFLKSNASRGLLGMGLSTAVLLPTAPLEASITKTIGGLVVSLVVAGAFALVVSPRCFPWIRAKV